MNKLISRNPIQRFKEGQKIQKFQNAGVISYKGRDGIDYEAFSGPRGWYYRKKGTQDILNMPKNYVTTTGIRFYDVNGNMIKNPSSNQNNSSNNTPESLDYRKALENNYYSQQGKGRSYTENGNNYWLGSDGSKTFISGKVTEEDGKEYWKGSDGSMTLLKSENSPRNSKISSGYMFGKMGGWNRSMGNTISDQESLNYLKEMGLDGQNALQIQQYINQQLGNNSVKEDNKWGNQSRAGLKALYDNWKLQQKPQTPASPIGNSVIESQRALEEIPQLSQDQLMFNNINSKTFNAPLPPRTIPYDRSMTRDIIKDITGNSAYNFTGDQRKALRQYLNGEQYDQEAIKAFGDLNQYNKYMKWRLQKGGILPSRNIVERFKQRNSKPMLLWAYV